MWARWLVVGLALACAGCQLHLQVEMALDRDGGGELELTLSADEALLEAARSAGADPLGELADSARELGDDWQVTERTADDGRRSVVLSTSAAGPDEYERVVGEVAAALSAPEAELLGPLSIAVDDERIAVSGRAGLVPTDAVGELGLAPDDAVVLLREEGVFRYDVRLTMPGDVVETTADRQDGRTLAWSVEPGSAIDVRAVGNRPEAPLWPLVAGGAAGLAVTGLALRAAGRRWVRGDRRTGPRRTASPR